MSTVQINTAFNVDLDFEVAPFHKRLVAYLIDFALLAIYLISMKHLLYDEFNLETEKSIGLDILIISLPMLLYSLLTEVLLNGQTIGKKVMKIRVISLVGGEPTFGQFILRQMPEDGDFAKFISASGFDPRRDLQEVLMATATGQKSGLVAARGTFDPQKIAALATADGKHIVSQYNGAQLLVSTEAASPALAFFDGNFAVAGDLVSVKAAIDRRKKLLPECVILP